MEKETMYRLTYHNLVKITTGARLCVITDTVIQKRVLTKRLKDRWILEEDLEDNYDTIIQWQRTRDFVNNARREIRELEENVTNMREQINNVESGKWKAWKLMLPTYKENLENWQRSLKVKKQRLKVAKIELKPLKASTKLLKDKFELYISGLEIDENG